MKFNVNPKVAKILLTGVGLGLTALGGLVSDRVKKDQRKDETFEFIKEYLENQAKES